MLHSLPAVELGQARNPTTHQSIRPMHLQFLSVVMRIPPEIDHIFEVVLR